MPSNDYSNVIFFCREEDFTPSFTVKVYRFFLLYGRHFPVLPIVFKWLVGMQAWFHAGLVRDKANKILTTHANTDG